MDPMKADGGFSLVELLAAIVILGILVGPLTAGFLTAGKRVLVSQRVMRANMLARQKAQQLIGTEFYKTISSETRSQCELPRPFDKSGSKNASVYDCQVTVSKVQSEDSDLRLKQIKIWILFPGMNGEERTIACSPASDCESGGSLSQNPGLTTYVACRNPENGSSGCGS